MSQKIFVDGICDIDDKSIQAYFSRFGSRITTYDSHRHRPTNSCCFALISLESYHTVNAILRHRPHSIKSSRLFVKRLLPSDACSFTERLLPVSSLFVYQRTNKQLDENKLREYFQTYGYILAFAYDSTRDCLFIEYDDYDSVDRLFLNKDQLPFALDLHKNTLPCVQSNIEYYGTCRRTATIAEEKKKTRHRKKTPDAKHSDVEYQDLLQKTIGNLAQCKAELRNKENDYVLLQIEHLALKDKHDQLTDLLHGNPKLTSCKLCPEHEVTIARLKQTLSKLNEQYDTLKSQYQRLLSTQCTPAVLTKLPTRSIQHLSTRLNIDEHDKQEVPDTDSLRSYLSTPVSCDIVNQQRMNLSLTTRSRIQQHRIAYKYHSVISHMD